MPNILYFLKYISLIKPVPIIYNSSFAANFYFTSPRSKQVIQRNVSTNKANITIKGVYTGPTISGNIEAKFGSGSWTTIASSLSPGAFNLTLYTQSAGVGTLQVRPAATPTDIALVNSVGIGIVGLIVGQSNNNEIAANYHLPTPGSVIATTFNASSFDPPNQLSNWVDTYCKAYFGTLQTSIINSTGLPVGFLCAAQGGTDIQKWLPSNPLNYYYPTQSDPNTSDYGQGVSLYQRSVNMVSDSGAGAVEFILWHQGEQDITPDGTAQATYQTNLQTIANQYFNDLIVKLMPCKLQHILQNDGVTQYDMSPVNTSVANLWSSGTAIATGPDFSSLTANYDTFGYVHLSSDSNVASVAAGWWNALKAANGYS